MDIYNESTREALIGLGFLLTRIFRYQSGLGSRGKGTQTCHKSHMTSLTTAGRRFESISKTAAIHRVPMYSDGLRYRQWLRIINH